jgi:hypothetical protein
MDVSYQAPATRNSIPVSAANPLPVAPSAGTVDLGTVQPYAQPGSRWQYAAAASGILNTTTAVALKGAAGAGLKNYITAIQLKSETLNTATELAIRDGAGGAVLWRTKLGTVAMDDGLNIVFPTPLVGTADTLLEVVTLTASVTGAVYFNAQGYTAA